MENRNRMFRTSFFGRSRNALKIPGGFLRNFLCAAVGPHFAGKVRRLSPPPLASQNRAKFSGALQTKSAKFCLGPVGWPSLTQLQSGPARIPDNRITPQPLNSEVLRPATSGLQRSLLQAASTPIPVKFHRASNFTKPHTERILGKAGSRTAMAPSLETSGTAKNEVRPAFAGRTHVVMVEALEVPGQRPINRFKLVGPNKRHRVRVNRRRQGLSQVHLRL